MEEFIENIEYLLTSIEQNDNEDEEFTVDEYIEEEKGCLYEKKMLNKYGEMRKLYKLMENGITEVIIKKNKWYWINEMIHYKKEWGRMKFDKYSGKRIGFWSFEFPININIQKMEIDKLKYEDIVCSEFEYETIICFETFDKKINEIWDKYYNNAKTNEPVIFELLEEFYNEHIFDKNYKKSIVDFVDSYNDSTKCKIPVGVFLTIHFLHFVDWIGQLPINYEPKNKEIRYNISEHFSMS